MEGHENESEKDELEQGNKIENETDISEHHKSLEGMEEKADEPLPAELGITEQQEIIMEHEDGPEIGDMEKGNKLERESDASELRKSFEDLGEKSDKSLQSDVGISEREISKGQEKESEKSELERGNKVQSEFDDLEHLKFLEDLGEKRDKHIPEGVYITEPDINKGNEMETEIGGTEKDKLESESDVLRFRNLLEGLEEMDDKTLLFELDLKKKLKRAKEQTNEIVTQINKSDKGTFSPSAYVIHPTQKVDVAKMLNSHITEKGVQNVRGKNVPDFAISTEMPFTKPLYGDPPPYDEIISDLKVLNHGDKEHPEVEDRKGVTVLRRELSSLRSNMSERLGSMEGTLTETSQVISQTHQLQQSMDERLSRIEQNLQAKQPQLELNEDRVSQRVVELLLYNEQFGARMKLVDESLEYQAAQAHGTVPIWKASCPKPCFCRCHFQSQHSNRENDIDDARSTRRSGMSSDNKKNQKDINPRSSEVNDKQLVYGACGGDPGESPSDDSSIDDDDERGHKNMNYRKKKKDKRGENESWEIDTDAWIACEKDGDDFEKKAKSLLKQGKLPNQFGLKRICSRCTTSSLFLKEICQGICYYIKSKSERIVDVWAATVYSKSNPTCSDDIVFVVLTTDTESVNEENFLTYQRYILKVEETRQIKEINRKEYDNPLSFEEKQKLEKCLRENGKLLMDSHSNLTRVTASWFTADESNTESPSIKRELCIALYVHIKGYIPLGEKHFPSEIAGFPVVVREGIFTLCGGADEYHQNVKMGCAIGAEQSGTLGAFIEIENDKSLYGLTCAHVVFQDPRLSIVLEKKNISFDNSVYDVYQPASGKESKLLGKIDTAIYKSGGNGLAGMEIALIKIDNDRWPTDGTFPDDADYAAAGFGPENPFVFWSGQVYNTTRNTHPSRFVYKYGCESKLTQGVCRFNGASVRTKTLKKNVLGCELVLHGQIEVQQIEHSPFSKYGDSGALAFTNDEVHGLSALGLIEGSIKDKDTDPEVHIITPINYVLHEIFIHKNKECRLKKFPQLNPQNNDSRINAGHSDTVSPLSVNVQHVQDKLDILEQDLTKHKIEITKELKRQSEELKRQGEENEKQSREIKEQTAEILALLRQSKS